MNDKNNYIQGARGLFCLMVFVFHAHNSGLKTFEFMNNSMISYLLDSLKYGVELFYGVSGIVILGSLTRSKSIVHFMWNRASRIFPVLWISVAFVTVGTVVFRQPMPGLSRIFASFLPPLPLFFGGNVNPIAWTLDFEVMFYLICAAVWFYGLRSTIAAIAILISIFILIVFPRTTMMLSGVIVYLNVLNERLLNKIRQFPSTILVSYVIFWNLIVLIWAKGNVDELSIFFQQSIFDAGFLFLAIIVATVLGMFALVGIVEGQGRLGYFLSSSPMVYIGTISYSFYLWHIPVMAAVKRVQVLSGFGDAPYSQFALLLISFIPSLLIAIISRKILEEYISKLLRKIYV